ncbi:hypothetical protein PR202_ga23551 [Eleusine coracana subsp. coracana]|uniref:Wall-associated receptor kinase C-terminal domain-containing protein n=1 Tax=Eleusine coracana subsp. coracana TaxID=191504 RepID=A0AAV5D636_ELECO|nr:hypothetical protein QOZ80_1AG0008790 [Eleusine coracana subsp. coracana]GJN05881.1 hypothetical protein PR202_ga23551 [Eleusine coracana subsp. coracana]
MVALLLLLLLPPLAAASHELGAACAPATCGNLTIRYPFWLLGRHPPYCGYPSLGVSCDPAAPTLNNSSLRVLGIDYGNRSLAAFHAKLAEDATACSATTFNVSATLALPLLAVSRANWALILCTNCSRSAPAGSLPVTCPGSGAWNVYMGRRYESGGPFVQGMAPAGCQYSVVPMMPGSELGKLDDYPGLVRRGFFLEWTVAGDCAACNKSGGQCRYDAGFKCLCPDGRLHSATCARGEFHY